MTFPTPIMMPGKSPVQISYLNSWTTGLDQTSYFLTPAALGSIGAADPTREILFITAWTTQVAGRTLSAVNYGSPLIQAGTVFSSQVLTGGGNGLAAAIVPIPTGTTLADNIEFAFTNSAVAFSVWAFRVTGRSSLGGNQYSGGTNTGSGSASTVSSLVVPYNGLAVGATVTDGARTIVFGDSGVGMTTGTTVSQDNGDTSTVGYGTTQTTGSIASIGTTWGTSTTWGACAWSLG